MRIGQAKQPSTTLVLPEVRGKSIALPICLPRPRLEFGAGCHHSLFTGGRFMKSSKPKRVKSKLLTSNKKVNPSRGVA